MALDYSNGLAAAVINGGIGVAFDHATAKMRLRIYSSAPAAATLSGRAARGNAAWPNDATLLGELTINPTGTDTFDTASTTPVGALIQALNAEDPTDDASADNTGTAAWFVAYRSDQTAITSVAVAADLRLVGTVATSAADLIINNASVVATGQITMADAAWGFAL